MRTIALGLGLVVCLAACGGLVSEPPSGTSVDAGRDTGVTTEVPPTPGEAPPSSSGVGLQYSGSVITEVNPSGPKVELSAPLFPNITVFQRFSEPSRYVGTTEAERLRLVDDEVKTFEQLLSLCAAEYPTITLRTASAPPLTLDQLRANYAAVARCGYDKYGAKPYWVPQMVSDIDICARKLGASWHLPTAAEIGALDEASFKLFESTLTALPGSDWFPVQWYYRLDLFARQSDGTLALGNLAPGATHLSPLPVGGSAMNVLYLGGGKPIGLRCMRSLAAKT